MKIAILNYEGVVASSVSGPYDMLTKTSQIASSFGQIKSRINFEVDIVNSPHLKSTGLGSVQGNKSLNQKTQYDLIIIPAMNFDCVELVLQREKEIIQWIKKQHTNGAELASICLGTFLLAITGILDGKKATTHWMGAQNFRMMFPNVELLDDKVIIDEGRIYSCGAAFSFTSLMIYLIEKFCGHNISVIASKVFMINVHDCPQSAFSIFHLQKSHGNASISTIQEQIEKNYAKKLTVEKLASENNMSLRTFIRRFVQATGNSPLQYIQRVKIEAAKRLLEKGREGVEQVCWKVGYKDFNFFRTIFKRHTGLTPQDYRKKYGNMFFEGVTKKSVKAKGAKISF